MVNIDWGYGRANIDHETGIHYGAISVHSVLQAWADSSESIPQDPTCPRCGHIVEEMPAKTISGPGWSGYEIEIPKRMENWEQEGTTPDYACDRCHLLMDNEAVSRPEEHGEHVIQDGEYQAEEVLESDILIIKSPYFTYARHCSPCLPGAGDLDSPDPHGIKAYCFGHDWFDEDEAPYPIYNVKTGKRVHSKK